MLNTERISFRHLLHRVLYPIHNIQLFELILAFEKEIMLYPEPQICNPLKRNAGCVNGIGPKASHPPKTAIINVSFVIATLIIYFSAGMTINWILV